MVNVGLVTVSKERDSFLLAFEIFPVAEHFLKCVQTEDTFRW